MHIEFMVEEPSAEAALQLLIPRIINENYTFTILVHQGKDDLLAKLGARLRGYSAWLPADWKIVVLLDRDDEDCLILKQKLEYAAQQAGLATRAATSGAIPFQVLNRIAIEELEAWFFGDVQAVVDAYAGFPITLAKRARFRDTDAIKGGTWEALERELQRVGYFAGGLPKIEAARTIANHMDPYRNNSRSFQVFRDGLLGL